MRAATVRENQIAVADHPDPAPRTDEVLVASTAPASIGADMLQLAGRYPAPRARPPVSPASSWRARWSRAAADVERFEPGDRVMALVGGGGQAELSRSTSGPRCQSPTSSTGPPRGVPEVFTTPRRLFTRPG